MATVISQKTRADRTLQRRVLHLEQLEDRLLLAVVSVSTNNDLVNGDVSSIASLTADDGGDGISLREAITAANNTANTGPADEIHFAIGSGPQTIAPTSPLPIISDPVKILGDTQPGGSLNPIIELNGANAGPQTDGLIVTAGDSEIRGLVINRFRGEGIHLAFGGFNVVSGNFIGTNVAGDAPRGNFLRGILLNNSSFNIIGGTQAEDLNVISGNGSSGIAISQGGDNTIQGNHIGVDVGGVLDVGNGGEGILVANSEENTIGGTTSDLRNVISGNSFNGIVLVGFQSNVNEISGNYIGTDFDGDADLGNDGAGILLTGFGPGDATTFNTIGGTSPGAGNVISGNGRFGIELFGGASNNRIWGNLIGTTPDGQGALGNDLGGIDVTDSSTNFIGGNDLDDGMMDGVVYAQNVISANGGPGIIVDGITATGNQIQGNYIGVAADGVGSLGNLFSGIVVTNGASDVVIGGLSATPGSDAGNVISGNDDHGVQIVDASAVRIDSNIIGASANGTVAVANSQNGIFVFDSSDVVIGGSMGNEQLRNLVSGNLAAGVRIEDSTDVQVVNNRIGTALDGTAGLGNHGAGVSVENSTTIQIGDSVTGGNLISANQASGIELRGGNTSEITVASNVIGTDHTGDQALGNAMSGILIEDAWQNRIGSTDPGDGNTISANGKHGIEIVRTDTDEVLHGSDNEIVGNHIGTNSAGTAALGNTEDGINVLDAPTNYIGVLRPANGSTLRGNVVSGNMESGVRIFGTTPGDAFGHVIQANKIGTAADGTSDLGNHRLGIYLESTTGVQVGGVAVGQGNTIAFNGSTLGKQGHGLVIAQGTRNAVRRNAFHSNHGRGIDLRGDSFDLNDPGDFDADENGQVDPDLANQGQNYPVITSVNFLGAVNQITFALDGKSNENYIWEFYANSQADPSGFGEGETFLLDLQIQTNSVGFAEAILTTDSANQFIAATVTDSDGNTSEFSMVDTDGDALADAWETTGIDVNEDGMIDLELIGADPMKKDIYVEIDAMVDRNPDLDALNNVQAAFLLAPSDLVNNPDGSPGMNLHLELGGDLAIPRVPFNDLAAHDWPLAYDAIKNGDPAGDHRDGTFGTPDERNVGNWDNIRDARLLAYRYAMFADVYVHPVIKTPVFGVAEDFGANDLFIALGAWGEPGGTTDQQAGVFMHELGHTLGLRHGGGDHNNNKPNYYSVMNYAWTEPQAGYSDSWVLDYSRVVHPAVHENALIENFGFGANPDFDVPLGPIFDFDTNTPLKPLIVPRGTAVDLDGDGDTTSTNVDRDVSFLHDTNRNKEIDDEDVSPGDVLFGFEDWSNLVFLFVGTDAFVDKSQRTQPVFAAGLTERSYDDHLLYDSFGSGPGTLQLSNSVYRTSEREGAATIRVARAGGTDGPVSVIYQTVAGGSASANGDYTTTSGTLDFADGEFLKSFTIPIDDDMMFEGTETVMLELTSPTGGATLGNRSTATLEITEPMLVSFTSSMLEVDETAGNLSIEVTLDGQTGQTLADDLVVRIDDLLTGSAEVDSDYNLPADTTVTFAAGSGPGAIEAVSITVLDNAMPDPTRTIDIALAPIDSFTATIGDSSALTVKIIDDEVGPLTSDFNVDGAVDAADFTVWRDTLGSTSNLAADADENGVVEQRDYDFWNSNFGATIGDAASSGGQIAFSAVDAAFTLFGTANDKVALRNHLDDAGVTHRATRLAHSQFVHELLLLRIREPRESDSLRVAKSATEAVDQTDSPQSQADWDQVFSDYSPYMLDLPRLQENDS